ncbi:hypothetical protein [Parasegetibacter sp. NRK P23]|uniref:hypothetical protein n=1 Tax=Parasegetibacter sp. NRK P23 TaxID=2942999 RepID=UPI002043E2D3|nr:hypothetical protein [Parasegetibacter sp. NRK P23]MCM5530106.1 hypothetical protein [Parasegetibacter sp. NRK P23]
MTLAEYVEKRNGVPIGHSKSLRNNLQRSLGAKNFVAFWNFWNPIFGYYLGRKIFKPIKKVLPIWTAVILTFIFCGLIHDLVTTLFRGRISLFFTIWFLFMGCFVALSKKVGYDLAHKSWIQRAGVNLTIIAVCFLMTVVLNIALNFY